MKVKKPVRSKSGVTILTLVLPPRKCDHGTCIYCPGGDTVPQSYTDQSPAIRRAHALDYDAKRQVLVRLDTLDKMGHPTDKLEVIIIGGTFMQYPEKFREKFIKEIYDTLNNKKSKSLEVAKKINEKTKHRVVALCIENRPDNCSEEDIKKMLGYGATRIELGVQILDDKIYKKTNRGHNIASVIDSTKRLKDAGFKIGYHIMPGLPFSNPRKDLSKFKKLFRDSDFKPDQLKLYPCQVVETSPLSKIFKRINYEPYDDKTLEKIVIKMLKFIPNYCRVMRIMREIPKEKMVAHANPTSMRGSLHQERMGLKEIRSREVGFAGYLKADKKTRLKITKYRASKGREYFLEIVDKNNILYALLRLRLVKRNSAIVRELHVYGQALKLKEKSTHSQHKGYGKLLMREAEKIARKKGYKKIKVISGVGVREYYKKLGYSLDDGNVYVWKNL